MLRSILTGFWSERVWLPPNTTWADIAPGPDKSVQYADYSDLIYPLPMALVILLIRNVLDRFWFSPVGISIGIKNTRPKKAACNPVLEAAYQKSSKIKHKQSSAIFLIPTMIGINRRPRLLDIAKEAAKVFTVCGAHNAGLGGSECSKSLVVALGKQLDMTERQVERWWRMRRSQDKPSTLVKFCENAWRCLYYLCSFCYGLVILWDKDWLWGIDHCYLGYPHQGITNDIWWYYMISLSFYWSLAISQFFDVKRKDFWQMFIHHIATIALMAFSWVCNLHRVGTLVLLLHDCVDIFLEAAKMTKYANYQKLCDCIFGTFTILWIVTRLGIFPFYIIWSTTMRAPTIIPLFPAYYIFNSLLFLLLILHTIWTWLILKVAYKALAAGQMEGDIRSSSSEVSDSSGTAVNIKGTPNNVRKELSNNHSNHSSGTESHKAGGNGTNSHNNTPKRIAAKKEE